MIDYAIQPQIGYSIVNTQKWQFTSTIGVGIAKSRITYYNHLTGDFADSKHFAYVGSCRFDVRRNFTSRFIIPYVSLNVGFLTTLNGVSLFNGNDYYASKYSYVNGFTNGLSVGVKLLEKKSLGVEF